MKCKICNRFTRVTKIQTIPTDICKRCRKVPFIKKTPEQLRINKLEYQRKRRLENPEKYREHSRNWKRRNPEKVRAYHLKYKKENPEKIKEKDKRAEIRKRLRRRLEYYSTQ